MAETKDPKIKLFGKTIELPETSPTAVAAAEADVGGVGSAQSCDAAGDNTSLQDLPSSSCSLVEDRNFNRDAEEQEPDKNKDISDEKQDDGNKEDQSQPLISDKLKDSQEKTEEGESETSNSQDQKTLKKPDKILPCPRCNSMDTKFCYFNNYNVNQPRHFCKNCQRYWTAGGTMRNVPVGAGRRKNKNAASHFRHVTIPEAHPNGLLNFRPDTPLCESMASVSIIADRAIQNGVHKPDEMGISISGSTSDQSSGTLKDEVGKNCHGPHPNQVPCFPGGPWAYPWSPVQWGPANIPMPGPFYPTPPYWGCAVPGPWWVVPPTASHQTPRSAGPNSPTLGKHLRDDTTKLANGEEEGANKESNPEKCLWVPKTLRIDDPGDAAKSSIWATLGIKNDSSDSIGGTGLFKAFKSQSKDDEKTPQVSGTSTVLQANPAAFSRSLNFHENS